MLQLVHFVIPELGPPSPIGFLSLRWIERPEGIAAVTILECLGT